MPSRFSGEIMELLGPEPSAVVAWSATTTEYAGLAPVVLDNAEADDLLAEVLANGARQVDALVRFLLSSVPLASRYLAVCQRVSSPGSRNLLQLHLAPDGDGVAGALLMARGGEPVSRVQGMLTEHISPRFVDLDSWSTRDIVEAMYEGQLGACAAVRPALSEINAAVDDAVLALKRGGRLVYVGAGTSGRIAVQDGTELPPTYNWPRDRLVFVMAGGMQALVQSAEGAEDNDTKGAEAIAEAKINQNDVVLGVAASGTTPFTVGALGTAAARGAVTIAVANNPGAPLFDVARHRIVIATGTEVLAGSTRMQAGTAQKIVLNLFSTAVMVKLGRVYQGLMVSMQARNAKLLRRAEIIVSQIVGCDAKEAAGFVQRAQGDVKLAILLGLGWEQADAIEALLKHQGNLRSVIGELAHDTK